VCVSNKANCKNTSLHHAIFFDAAQQLQQKVIDCQSSRNTIFFWQIEGDEHTLSEAFLYACY